MPQLYFLYCKLILSNIILFYCYFFEIKYNLILAKYIPMCIYNTFAFYMQYTIQLKNKMDYIG